jgi:hypothetical protein
MTVYIPDREKIVTIQLPRDKHIFVPDGYGLYKLSRVKELSQIETDSSALLQSAIMLNFSIPITTTIESQTTWDSIRSRLARRVYAGRQDTLDLSQERIYRPHQREDGEALSVVDEKATHRLLSRYIWEQPIVDDTVTVGVFNAAKISGLATDVSRILETVGMNVVAVGNWEEEWDQVGEICDMYVYESAKATPTVDRLSSLFSCEVIIVSDRSHFDVRLVMWKLL